MAGDGERSVVLPWGLVDALVGYAGGYVAAGVLAAAIGAGPDPSLAVRIVVNLPFWAALVGVPVLATRRRGRGPVIDLGLGVAPVDLLAVLVGGAMQVVVNLAYSPFVEARRLEAPARELADGVHGARIVLLVLLTCVAAPIAEEVFYRGLVMRSLQRRTGSALAVVLTAVVFAASHFQALQFAGLAAFGLLAGLLARRTGRLGTAICSHVGFNAVALWLLYH